MPLLLKTFICVFSPRQSSSGMLRQDITASPLTTRNSFLTKETFSAEMASKHSPLKVQMINLGCSAKEGIVLYTLLINCIKLSIKDHLSREV